jgi:hypothetical protein
MQSVVPAALNGAPAADTRAIDLEVRSLIAAIVRVHRALVASRRAGLDQEAAPSNRSCRPRRAGYRASNHEARSRRRTLAT